MSATTNKKTAQGMHPQEGNKAKRPDAVPHGGPKVPQKAAPGTTKRIFGYISNTNGMSWQSYCAS